MVTGFFKNHIICTRAKKVKVTLAYWHGRQTEIPKLVLHINTERNKLITFITKLNKFNTNAVYMKKCAE